MNFVALSGRLTKDPEVRYTQDGLAIASYSLAVDRPRAKDKEQQTDFFNCTAFGKQGEFAGKYLKKGTKILIDGSLQLDSWTDQGGNKRSTVKVIVNRHEFCESKKDSEKTPDPATPGEFLDIPDSDEELPFNF